MRTVDPADTLISASSDLEQRIQPCCAGLLSYRSWDTDKWVSFQDAKFVVICYIAIKNIEMATIGNGFLILVKRALWHLSPNHVDILSDTGSGTFA